MQITDLRREQRDGRVRIAANLTWEDCDRPSREIYYETSSEYGDALTFDPGVFLLAAAIPAMRHAEQRIRIEGSICPLLAEGIQTNIRTLIRWHGPPRILPQLEPTEGMRARTLAEPRAGLFLSGGVDSLFMLRENRRRLPLDHPNSFKDAVFVYGIDMGGVEGWERQAYYEAGLKALQPIVEETKLQLMPISTNVKLLNDGLFFYQREAEGAILASIAQAFSRRITQISIAASDTVDDLGHYGSHPMIDPYYSNSALQVHHETWMHNRIEKIAGILDWETAMANLRVCFEYRYDPADGDINCGKCGKCMRTMLGILAAGGDASVAKSLPMDRITPKFIKRFKVRTRLDARYTRNLVQHLEGMGRDDLTSVLRSKLRSRQWIAPAFALDRRYLGGWIGRQMACSIRW